MHQEKINIFGVSQVDSLVVERPEAVCQKWMLDNEVSVTENETFIVFVMNNNFTLA